MQRFKYIPRTYTVEGEYGGYFDKADDGEYVLHSEAQARIEALEAELTAERERRVELEAALTAAYENLNGWCEAIDHTGTGWDDWDEWFKDAKYERKGKPSVLSILRAALRVETK